MTLDELTTIAHREWINGTGPTGHADMREVVLIVLDAVEWECVPNEVRVDDKPREYSSGWFDCRAEMLRRLQEMRGLTKPEKGGR